MSTISSVTEKSLTSFTKGSDVNSSQAANTFSGVLLATSNKAEAPNNESALTAFYEIHQRSQITGVSTSEYNQAVKALGIDPVADPFAAIKLLEESGYDTSKPSQDAIDKYGSKPQAYGNQTYLAQAEEVNLLKTSNKLPNAEQNSAAVLSTTADNQKVLESSQSLPQGSYRAALDYFYVIHQRSQITGVPTNEYNQAVRELGLDPVANPSAGIQALEAAGYNAGMPTLGAILEYGSQPQDFGNQSYLAQNVNEPTVVASQVVDTKDLVENSSNIDLKNPSEEIQALNHSYDGILGSASNYYEAVRGLAANVDLVPYKNLSLTEALPLIQTAFQEDSFVSTDWWLNRNS